MTIALGQHRIELPVFAGPLDLLLHLIERNELDITAISLLAVTDQYLERLAQLKEGRIDSLADFLVVAARLLAAKSRALLPRSPAAIVGEVEDEDPAEALARQLRLYKQFKEAAFWLAEREAAGMRTYLRVAPPPRLDTRLDLTGVTSATLAQALLAALSRVESLEESVSVAVDKQAFSINQQIERVRRLAADKGRFLFSEVLSTRSSWSEVSVTLLAVLELVKRHELNVWQRELFGPIEIETTRHKREPQRQGSSPSDTA
jgi:segregation and condensation protein A